MNSEPNPNEELEGGVVDEERRSSDREDTTGRAIVRVGGIAHEAIIQNRSEDGLLVVVGEAIQVELELGEGEERRTTRAYLRRLHGLPGGSYGVGLELVPEDASE